MPIEYYPEIKYADYKTDNPNLYIAVEQNNDNSLNLKIIETDSQKKEKVNLNIHQFFLFVCFRKCLLETKNR